MYAANAFKAAGKGGNTRKNTIYIDVTKHQTKDGLYLSPDFYHTLLPAIILYFIGLPH